MPKNANPTPKKKSHKARKFLTLTALATVAYGAKKLLDAKKKKRQLRNSSL